jgi:hypothetical protein
VKKCKHTVILMAKYALYYALNVAPRVAATHRADPVAQVCLLSCICCAPSSTASMPWQLRLHDTVTNTETRPAYLRCKLEEGTLMPPQLCGQQKAVQAVRHAVCQPCTPLIMCKKRHHHNNADNTPTAPSKAWLSRWRCEQFWSNKYTFA